MILEDKYKIKLLRQLYGHEKLPISDLSKGIGKSIPFTSSLVSELVKNNILQECGLADSNGGRRPQLYAVKNDIYYTIGIALNQIRTTFAIFDLKGDLVQEKKSKNILLDKSGDDLIAVGEFISECIEQSGLDKNKILGIGMGMPGFIDINKGINYTFLRSEEGSVVSYLENLLKLPIFIDNDSSLIGLAELRHGWAKGQNDALVINIGWGVGLGMIISKKVFRGENGFAGEFSHIPIYENNKVCSCGKRGCLETETSLYVLIQKAKEGIEKGVYTILPEELPKDRTEAVQVIFQAISQGDNFAIELLTHLGQHLGRGISILIHLFNPGLVVLSGFGAIPGKYWWAPVQQSINVHSIGKLSENTELKISKLGSSAELVGAAALVIERLEEIKNKQGDNYRTSVN